MSESRSFREVASPSDWWSLVNPHARFKPSAGGFPGAWMLPYSDQDPPDPAQMKLLLGLGYTGEALAFNSTDGVDWRPVGAPWPLRSYAAAAIIGDLPGSAVGMFGGNGARQLLDDFWYWDGLSWTQLPKPPPPRPWPQARAGANLVNPGDGSLWLLAGSDPAGVIYRDLWLSRTGGLQWERVTPTAPYQARTHACAFGFKDPHGGGMRLWLGAGEVSGHAMQAPWLFDGQTWTPLPQPQWPPRARANVAVMGQLVFLFGGIGLEGRQLTDLWGAQLTDLTEWTLLDPHIPPGNTTDAACAVRGDSLLLTAGELSDAVWRMTPKAG